MTAGLLQLLGGAHRAALEKGVELWLISAHELLQARAEAAQMAQEEEDALGLWLNACILARAARKDGKRLFASGAEAMQRLSAERIGHWMQKYLALCAQEDPSCCTQGHEELREALRQDGYERLKWRVLRAFGVLPGEKRAREMTEGEYLYCVMQLSLDEEERMEQLCPTCREQARERRCVVCGAPLGEENPNFDEARFEELRRGGLCAGNASGAGGAGGTAGRADESAAAAEHPDTQKAAGAGADAEDRAEA